MANQAAHEEIRNLLCMQILNTIAPGDKIPSERSFQKVFNASRTTINKAISQLVSVGLLERRKGWGTFVCERQTEKLAIRMIYYLTGLDDDFLHPGLLNGVEKALRSKGHSLILSGSPAEDAAVGGIKENGAIFVGTVKPERINAKLMQGIPAVLADYEDETLNVDSVGIDNFRAGELAAQTLLAKGHTRIAYLGHYHRSTPGCEWPSSKERRRGVIAALRQQGFALAAEYDRSSGSITKPLSELFSLPCPPTSVVLFSDDMLLLALHALSELGIKSPDDVSLISIGGTPTGNAALFSGEFKRCACVEFSWLQMAQEAVSLLLKRIENPLRPISRIKIDLHVNNSEAVRAI